MGMILESLPRTIIAGIVITILIMFIAPELSGDMSYGQAADQLKDKAMGN